MSGMLSSQSTDCLAILTNLTTITIICVNWMDVLSMLYIGIDNTEEFR